MPSRAELLGARAVLCCLAPYRPGSVSDRSLHLPSCTAPSRTAALRPSRAKLRPSCSDLTGCSAHRPPDSFFRSSAPPPATAKKMESLPDKLLESRCSGGRRKTLTPHPTNSKKWDPLDLASKGSQTRNRGPRKIGGPTGIKAIIASFGCRARGNQKSAPQRSAHFTGTFLTFTASKRPFWYPTAFALSQAARRAFWAHEFEQNRFALETRRPLLHFGMTAPQPSHLRLTAGSMPIFAITARLSFFSR